MTRLIITAVLALLLASWTLSKKFPKFNYTTTQGKEITNDYFNDTTTIVVHFHIGCPGAMVLITDLQKYQADNHLQSQLLFIAENTNDQILQFNSDKKNMWSGIRKYFGVGAITNDIVGECLTEKIEVINGDTLISAQCKEMAKKLKIDSSPVTYRVNDQGEITGVYEGYASSSNIEFLENMLQELE